ncbi:hypothetical protein CMEL01_03281 [Colletotrichum melonis]|nr:hypothetical protein CCUS01_11058 [Colletotrichum cuscutae]KAK1460282.1 hypothetical protein CMEL01_03281 [Colletotrichum melonis]
MCINILCSMRCMIPRSLWPAFWDGPGGFSWSDHWMGIVSLLLLAGKVQCNCLLSLTTAPSLSNVICHPSNASTTYTLLSTWRYF